MKYKIGYMLLALPKSPYPGPMVHQDELSDEVLFFKKYYKKTKNKKYYLQFDPHQMGSLIPGLGEQDPLLCPHQHERKFYGARVCKVTFKYLIFL